MASAADTAAAQSTASPSDFFTLPDASGLPVTLPSRLGSALGSELVGWLDAYARQVFVYGRAWDCVLRAINLSDEALMPQILAIDFFIAKNDIVNAGRSLAQAKLLYRSQSSVVTARESLYLRGYSCMLDNQLRASLQSFQSVLDLCPGDLFAVKKVQLLAFVLGGKEEMLAVVQRPDVEAACANRPFFHAMKAFALEENEKFAEAGRAVARGLELEPHDPWAVHVRAHLFYAAGGSLDLHASSTFVAKAGDVDGKVDGSVWLESHASEWSECMSFMYVHCWFHDALLRLDLDQIERTKSIFDQHVWPFEGPEETATTAAAVTATAATASTASPSASSLPHFDLPGDNSFGVPCTALSFQRNDRFYVEDQNGAMNLLWRMEMRVVGAGAGKAQEQEQGSKQQEAAPGEKREADSATASAVEKKQRLDSAAAGSSSAVAASASSSSSAAPASSSSRFSLHYSAFDSRWHSIASCLTLPPTQGLSLFGLLQLYALCRCGRMPEAKQVVDLYTADVAAVADEVRRAALEGVLLPIARAIYQYHTAPIAADGVAHAWTLMHQLLVLDPAAAESTSGSGVSTEGLGVSASSSVADPSGAATTITASASPSPVHRSASAARLGCLAASGEQLEVLVEWYLELCASHGKWKELQDALREKLQERREVQWYQRLNSMAQTKINEARS